MSTHRAPGLSRIPGELDRAGDQGDHDPVIRVTQFSDTHFTTSDEPTHGGLGYDTDETWDLIHAHAFATDHPDLVVVTGDVVDNGLPEEYAKAAKHLARIPVQANVCIGNHDFQVPFDAVLPGRGLTTSRTMRLGAWLFLFADSNFGGRSLGDDGRLHDRHDRIESPPQLGDHEVAWIDETIASTDADHVFLWVHHPPRSRADTNPYESEVRGLFQRHESLRGMGVGHTHTDKVLDIEGRKAYTCPAFTINLDLPNETVLPPGYRTYEFGDDGSVSSESHLLDDPRWPRRRLEPPVSAWLRGEMSYDDMQVAMAAARNTKPSGSNS